MPRLVEVGDKQREAGVISNRPCNGISLRFRFDDNYARHGRSKRGRTLCFEIQMKCAVLDIRQYFQLNLAEREGALLSEKIVWQQGCAIRC